MNQWRIWRVLVLTLWNIPDVSDKEKCNIKINASDKQSRKLKILVEVHGHLAHPTKGKLKKTC